MSKEIITNKENQNIVYNRDISKYIYKNLYYFDTLKELYKFQSKQQEHRNKKSDYK